MPPATTISGPGRVGETRRSTSRRGAAETDTSVVTASALGISRTASATVPKKPSASDGATPSRAASWVATTVRPTPDADAGRGGRRDHPTHPAEPQQPQGEQADPDQ